MTQGRIERYHRSMKNVVRRENHYSPWELGLSLGDIFVPVAAHQKVSTPAFAGVR